MITRKQIKIRKQYINICQKVYKYLKVNYDILDNQLLCKAYIYLRKHDPYKVGYANGTFCTDLGAMSTTNTPYRKLYLSNTTLCMSTVVPNLYSDNTSSKIASTKDFLFILSKVIDDMKTWLDINMNDRKRILAKRNNANTKTNKRVEKMEHRHTDFSTMVIKHKKTNTNEKKNTMIFLENLLDKINNAPYYNSNSFIDPYHNELKFISGLKEDILTQIFKIKLNLK